MVPRHKKNHNQTMSKKEHDGHNADESREPRNRAGSMPKEELSINSQGDKTKSNKTSVFSKTSRVLDPEFSIWS